MNTKIHKIHIDATPSIVATLISAQPSSTSRFEPSENATFSTLNQALLIIMSFALVSALGLAIRGLTWAYRYKRHQQSSSGHAAAHLMPCQQCQYFGPNPYLKCAIHPMTVMTEASADCSDYWPNRND
jgi:hypothetical protein